jgi:hypothetical protein
MAREILSKADILRAIQGLHRSGVPLNYSAVKVSHHRLLVRARKKFKTWRGAIAAAGLDYEEIALIHRWSKPEILNQLRELCKREQFPDISTLSRKFPKLYQACCRQFGSGLAALKAAGIDYEELLGKHPYRWTRARIIEEMQRRHEEGKSLRRSEILRKEPRFKRFCYAANNQFGNWSKALRAAKLNPDVIRNRDGLWPRERVLAGIRSRYEKGKLLNTDLMLREDLPLHAAGRRHFGTWKVAIEKAGIDYNRVRGGLQGWTKSKALKALRERFVDTGLIQKQVREHSPSLYRAAIHHFGSWEDVLREARR